jgi:outer membrane protein TolC
VSIAQKLTTAVIALSCALAPPLLEAQDPWPLPVDDAALAALIEEALAKNPEVAAARAATEAAATWPAQARSLPNPMIGTDYTNDGWSPSLGSQEMTTLAFMASQEFPYPGKRALRAALASRQADRVALEVERVRRRTTAATKRAYYGLLLSRETLEVIDDQEQIWQQIEGVARARYAVGRGALQDVLRAQVEMTRIEELRAEQEARAQAWLAELNRLLDRPPAAALDTAARLTLRSTEVSLDQILAWAREVSPELEAAGLGTEAASIAVDLAEKAFRPDWSVQAGYMNRGSLDPMWQAGVAISLPLYRKRLSAGVAEAEASVRSAQAVTESIGLLLRQRTQERLARLSASQRITLLYGQGIVPQDRNSVEAAIANYQTGQVPFVAVLEALVTLYNDRSTHLRLLAEHEEILASLEEAGLEDTASMTEAGSSAGAVGGAGLAGTAGGMGSAAMGSSAGMGNP